MRVTQLGRTEARLVSSLWPAKHMGLRILQAFSPERQVASLRRTGWGPGGSESIGLNESRPELVFWWHVASCCTACKISCNFAKLKLPRAQAPQCPAHPVSARAVLPSHCGALWTHGPP